MAKIACCHNCVYSYCDHEHALWSMSVGVLTWPACANHPDSLGRMRRVPARGICRNYRPRPATPAGEVKQIPLGEGLYACVDAADFERLSQWTWHLSGGYAMRRQKGKAIFLHREIVRPPKGMVVDHVNRNKLDDTRANLRVCTLRENACNRDKKRGSSSRFIGVRYRKDRDKWRAEIRFEGKPIFLGHFAEEIDAARAHDRAAVEYSGASARLNFPGEWPAERCQEVQAQRDAAEKEKGKSEKGKGKNKGAKARTRPAHEARRASGSVRAPGHRPQGTTMGKEGARPKAKGKGEKGKGGRRAHPARQKTQAGRARHA